MKILTESETLDRALAGTSISRFGDGELRLALGGSAASQQADPKLADELRSILRHPGPELVCLPFGRSAKPLNWAKYNVPKFADLLDPNAEYGSAFISRPDSAPWIDTPEYWAKVKKLWAGKDIVLVVGDNRSLRESELADARSLRTVISIGKNAYAVIDTVQVMIERLHGQTPGCTVIMCLGATATVLAHRLAVKGIHAVDCGHLGMFMRHAGSYNYDNSNLISPEYREQNRLMHEGPDGYGGGGHKHAAAILALAKEHDARSILDYGCGEGTLKMELAKRCTIPVKEYDPAVVGKEAPPKPADLVVCTDVVEHVEPEKLNNVLRHIRSLTGKVCFMVIATRPANKTLPDGRNTHLIVEPAEWWLPRLEAAGFRLDAVATHPKRIVACLVPA